MSNDCCNKQVASMANVCPGCGKSGVSLETVKSMVTIPLWDIEPNDQFFYDDDVDSKNVYFSTKSGLLIDEADVREKIFHKHPNDDDCYVCYCFRISVGDLRQATPEKRQEILERIKTASKHEQCSCETRNPKGSCCVGDVKNLIDKFNAQ